MAGLGLIKGSCVMSIDGKLRSIGVHGRVVGGVKEGIMSIESLSFSYMTYNKTLAFLLYLILALAL